MYKIPKSIYDKMVDNERAIESLIVSTKEDLESAKELGDLSENSAYDSAKYRLGILNKVYEDNERFMESVQATTDEELLTSKLFKKYTLSLEEIGSQSDKAEEFVGILTPPVPLDLDVEQIYSDSKLGEKLLTTDDKSFWINTDDRFIRVEIIGVENVDF